MNIFHEQIGEIDEVAAVFVSRRDRAGPENGFCEALVHRPLLIQVWGIGAKVEVGDFEKDLVRNRPDLYDQGVSELASIDSDVVGSQASGKALDIDVFAA